MDAELSVFSERLREERKRQSLSQAALAEQAGMTSPQSISTYEKGTKSPTLANIVMIAKALGVSIDWLCGLDKNNKTKELRTYRDVIDTLLSLGECFYRAKIESSNGKGYAKVIFYDGEIDRFLCEFDKMLGLLNEDTITNEIFEMWLAGRREHYGKMQLPTNPLSDLYDIEETDSGEEC